MSAKNDDGGVWVNIYKLKDRDIYWTGSVGYSTKKIAEEGLCDEYHKIATVDIKKALAAYEEVDQLKEQLAEHKEYCCCQKNEVLLLENEELKEDIEKRANECAKLRKQGAGTREQLEYAKVENQKLRELLWTCQAYFNNQLNDNWAKSIVMDIDNAIGEKK